MEFGILIFVNLVFLAFFYFLFSIRLGKISEKTKNSKISKDLYENIELVIRYLDATVETVNHKTDSFYRLLQRAEELKRELEQLSQELEKRPKRKRKPNLEAQNLEIQSKIATDDTQKKVVSNQKPSNSVAERILNQQTETDRFEFSSSTGDLAQLIGAQKNRENQSSQSSDEGILSGIGRFTRKVFGLPLIPISSKELTAHKNQATSDQDFTKTNIETIPIQPVTNISTNEPITYSRPENKFSNIEVPDLSNPKERADFIRLLLRKSMRVDEISTLTGISLGEIQFVQKVMLNTNSRSKNRS